MEAGEKAHELGYSAVLYLDPKEKKYIDECGPANFFCSQGWRVYHPCKRIYSPSVTNNSLMTLAEDMGIKVERRHIPLEELAEIQEAAACGTAAVASPVAEIHDLDLDVKYIVAKDGEPGPVTTSSLQPPPRHSARRGARHPRLEHYNRLMTQPSQPTPLPDRQGIIDCFYPAGTRLRDIFMTHSRSVADPLLNSPKSTICPSTPTSSKQPQCSTT